MHYAMGIESRRIRVVLGSFNIVVNNVYYG